MATSPRLILPSVSLSSLVSLLLLAPLGCQEEVQPVAPAASGDETQQRGGGTSDAAGGGGFGVSGSTITQKKLGSDPDGQAVIEFELTNSHGMRINLINYGAIIRAVRVPDKDEKYANVTLGFKSAEGYFEPGPYFGAICGRYSNRIAGGKFKIADTEYSLATNNDENHLHGGTRGFNRRMWQAEILEDSGNVGVKLQLESPDGEEAYPGTLSVTVTYWLTERNELRIEYEATTDKPTVLNLTNHCYWNLGGAAAGDILGHELKLECSHYLPVDSTLIPTGKRTPVAETPMSFLQPQTIGSRIKQVEGGYDHCYIVTGADGSLRPVAEVHDPGSGRVMEILSTEPGVQFYTGNFLDGASKNGGYALHGGFCLECQHFPDSPNQPDFPTTLLKPGETYTQTTVHRFSIRRPGGPGGRRGARKSSGDVRKAMIKRLDKDSDGKISKKEASFLSSRFDSLDTNSDGFIDAEELEASRKRRGRGGKKDKTSPGPAAKTKKPAAKTKKKDPKKKSATP